MFALFAPGPWELLYIGMIVIIPLTGFWIWMLVDCLTNKPSDGNDKIIWVLVVVLVGWLGAILYYFVRRPERIRKIGK